MQVFDLRTLPLMTRDIDLIREILMRIEQDSQMDGTREFYFNNAEEIGFPNRSSNEILYNLGLLVKEGFVEGSDNAILPIMVRTLTWRGHEFLDSIKDPGIWKKTKARISDLQSVTLRVVAAIAEAEIKKHFGLK
jgi:hypothetical protein